MGTNWKFLILVVTAAFLASAALWFLFPPAQAAENGTLINISTVNVTDTNLTPVTFSVNTRIMQGQCVELNSTIDVSGLGWYSGQIDYFGRYFRDFSPVVNQTTVSTAKIPSSVKAAREFYVDPAIFGPYPGYWYAHYDTDQKAGNSRFFYVNETCPMNESNWIIRPTESVVVISNKTPAPTGRLDERHVTDILLAHGDTLAYVAPNNTYSRVWVFGPGGIVYDYPTVDNVVQFKEDVFRNIPPGDYNVLIIQPGPNGIVEEYYDPAWKPERFSNDTWPAIISPFRDVDPININGMPPLMVQDLLEQRVMNSRDDVINKWKLTVQEPEIQIMQINQIITSENLVWVNIRGYTNVVNNTELTIKFDAGTPGYGMTGPDISTIAKGTEDPGAWRQFNSMFLVNFKDISPGPHSYTMTSPQGASATVPIYKRVELPAHYVPNQTLEFFDNSPFIPKPTPEIVEKVVEKEVIKYQTVIEKEPLDYPTLAYNVSIWLIPLLIAIPVGIYILIVLVSARKKGS
jgi:hypothetical protein